MSLTCVACCVQEDKKVKDRIDARNTLESYCYNMKNSLEDSEKGLADKMGADDKETVEKAVQVCVCSRSPFLYALLELQCV